MRAISRRYNDPSAPAFDVNECEFRCAYPNCGEGANEAMPRCEACLKMFCADHLTACEDLLVCADCFKCTSCGKEATGICGECGDFTCPDCAVDYAGGQCCETGVQDAASACKSCLRGTHQGRPVVMQEDGAPLMYADTADCPF